MTTTVDQRAALVALLRSRPKRLTWNAIAAKVIFAGDAVSVWEELAYDGGMVADPRAASALADARREVQQWDQDGLTMLTVLDDEYPARLLDIRETPPVLFLRGNLVAEDRGMSVVGSRRASHRGHQIATLAAELLVAKGLTVIAGLAAGIDTTAHQTALAEGGRTVAMLGTGITHYYPTQNRNLQEEIASRGLVLSQFWPAAHPTRQSFPIRNAAMSGYGMGTVVIEAGETSGTRIQARVAIEHGRPVILTDMVVEQTRWGRALVGRPGVHVVSGADDLDRTVDEVLNEQGAVSRVLQSLEGVTPSLA